MKIDEIETDKSIAGVVREAVDEYFEKVKKWN